MNSELKYIGRGVLYIVMIFAIIAVAYFIVTRKKSEPATVQYVNITYENLMQTTVIASGKVLFDEYCSSCHAINNRHEMFFGKIAGNDYDKKTLYAFIRNSDSVIQSGNAYYVELFNEFNKTKMKSFPNLTDEELDKIMAYIKVKKNAGILPKH